MERTERIGMMEGRISASRELLSSTTFKDGLRLFLKDIDPESGPELVRTLMGTDTEVPMALVYDAINHRVESFSRAENLFHYLRYQYAKPTLALKLLPMKPTCVEVEVWDAATGCYLGYWWEDSFDFAGANDETVIRLDALFRHHLPLEKASSL